MKGYKGFEKGLICRGKQYAENTVFEEEGAEVCRKGMHFCKNPLNVLEHYGFVDDKGNLNEFAEVEALDNCKTNDGKKFVTTKLKVGKKLSTLDFIRACATEVDVGNTITSARNHTVAISMCDCSSTANSGNSSIAANRDFYSVAAVSGYNSVAASAGDYSVTTNIGNNSISANAGDNSAAINAGNYSTVTNTGDYSVAINASKYSTAVSTGSYSLSSTYSVDSIAIAAGFRGKAKGKKGSYIAVAEWKQDKGHKLYLADFKAVKVDGEIIKEDTFYTLKDGEFVEAE